MKLKIVFAIASLCILSTMNYAAMPKNADYKNSITLRVKMPSAKVLAERLTTEGFADFIEKIHIHDKLGDQTKSPVEVIIQVELSLDEYKKYHQHSIMATILGMYKDQIIKALLQDYPKELQQLKEQLACAASNASAATATSVTK